MAVANLVAIVFCASYALFSGVPILALLILLQGVFIWIIELKSNLIEDLLKIAKEQERTLNMQNEIIKKYING